MIYPENGKLTCNEKKETDTGNHVDESQIHYAK